MDREAWRAVIHGVPKSQTWLSDWTELNWDPQDCQKNCTILIHVFEISNSPKAKMALIQINKNFGFLSSFQFGPVFICYLVSLPVFRQAFLIFHTFYSKHPLKGSWSVSPSLSFLNVFTTVCWSLKIYWMSQLFFNALIIPIKHLKSRF